jgi:transcriptional regulator GlxA family with amidase domain
MTLNVGIFIFPNVEVLDFAGPYEVFTTATRMAEKMSVNASFSVFTVGQSGNAVRARAGLLIQPDHSFDNCPKIDLLIVPGGVVDDEMKNATVLEWIRKIDQNSTITASVCTGAFLLARADIVKTHKVTTHWEDTNDLRAIFPSLDVIENVRWVDEGKYVTSAGITAGIDMCLHLVEKTFGRELAVATARQLEFDWTEN